MRIGTPDRWRAVLKAEIRRTRSTRLWWLLLIPVVLIAVSVSLFGGLIKLMVPTATDTSSILMLSGLAAALGMVSIIGAAYGTLLAAGEYRHRTITLAFLTGSRVQVIGAKAAVGASVAALYGLVVAVLGPLLGGAVLGGQQLPDGGQLAGIGAIGVLVCALWGALGVGVGTLLANQAGAVAAIVGYLLIGENLIAAALQAGHRGGGDPSVFARLSSFLPGNAGDIALYEAALRSTGVVADPRTVLEFLAGVSAPPPGWVALLVLVVWTIAGIALAVVVGGRRDIT